MKKLVKKIVVAVLAMAMAIGMLAVSTSAADDLGPIYIVGSFAESGWGNFIEMEETNHDGEYKYVLVADAGTEVMFKFTLQQAWEDEVAPFADGSYGRDGNFVLTVPENTVVVDGVEKNGITIFINTKVLGEPEQNGDHLRYRAALSTEADKCAVDSGVDAAVNAGDNTPFIAIAAVAVLALGAVVVLASKKKVVTE